MDFTESEHRDLIRVQQALLEGREKASQTVAELSNLINRVDVKLAQLTQIQGHPPAMCDVVEQMSKNKKLDKESLRNREAVPAVVLVKKR